MSKSAALLMIMFSGLCAAFSQILLKISTVCRYRHFIFDFINWRVITSYSILFFTTIINMYAMRFVEYKYVPIIGTISYVFVVLLSSIFLRERIGRNKLLGMLLILGGILVFNF